MNTSRTDERVMATTHPMDRLAPLVMLMPAGIFFLLLACRTTPDVEVAEITAEPVAVSAAPTPSVPPAASAPAVPAFQPNVPSGCEHSPDAEYCLLEQARDALYHQLVHEYAEEPQFLTQLANYEAEFERFRTAQLFLVFPLGGEGGDKRAEYGSVYPLCAKNELVAMTRAHLNVLKQWTEGVPEGDVCMGSRHMAK